MLAKTLKAPIVCWPHIEPKGAVADATIIEPGETVRVRENEERRTSGRLLVMVGDTILFCNCQQFWNAVN
jgi:hypothetical protein